MARKTYTIPDMHCSACVMLLEGLEDELPGITTIQASYQKQRMVVEFDEQQVTEAEILTAIHELGYSVVT